MANRTNLEQDFLYKADENYAGDPLELVTLCKELSIKDESIRIDSEIETETETETTTTSTSIEEEELDSDNSEIKLSNTAQRFRALGKIVHFLRKRFLSGNGMNMLSFDEILKETKQTEISADIKKWLKTEALPNNKRINVVDAHSYQFKPVFQLKNSTELIELLKERDHNGLGGILMEDIRESLPNYRQVLKECHSNILILKRSFDRKRIVYYMDPESNRMDDYDVQAMWRTLGLEDIEEVNEQFEDVNPTKTAC